jgi:hypothetical protein
MSLTDAIDAAQRELSARKDAGQHVSVLVERLTIERHITDWLVEKLAPHISESEAIDRILKALGIFN